MADPADLEQLAARLEQSDDYRVLRRVPVVTRYADDDPAITKRLGLIVDIETTGLDPAGDRIIELACLPFHFSSEGALYDVLPGYAGFEDPGQPLDGEVVRLTGITDEQLRGRKLDEEVVTTLAAAANLVIAHNATFDRCFLERRFPLFVDKPWACTMGQVPWAEEGLGSARLDYLLSRLGFFFDDHRAMADCRAVLHLLSLSLPYSGRPILPLLLAKCPSACVPYLGAGGADRLQGTPQAARLPLERRRGWPAARLVSRPGQRSPGRGGAVPGGEGLWRGMPSRAGQDRLQQPLQRSGVMTLGSHPTIMPPQPAVRQRSLRSSARPRPGSRCRR